MSDSFLLHDRDLGKLELTAQPLGADWQIQRVELTNDDGKLSAQGWWRVAGRAQQTTLDADLDIVDAGPLPHALWPARRGHRRRLEGPRPDRAGRAARRHSTIPTLSGAFNIKSGPGQFLKVDPGAGKLLGVLSLQSLHAPALARFPRSVRRGIRLRRDHRRRAHPERSHEKRQPATSSARPRAWRSAARPTSRARPSSSRCASSRRCRRAYRSGAALLLIANPIIGAAVARRLVAGAEGDAGPVRADVLLRICRQRQLVGPARRTHRPPGDHGRRSGRRASRSVRDERQPLSSSPRCRRSPAATSPPTSPPSKPQIAEAARRGAQLVVLPEYFGIFGGAPPTRSRRARPTATACSRRSLLASRAHAASGSSAAPSPSRSPIRRACAPHRSSIAPDGRRVARYDKMHLFTFSQGDERYDESKTIEPGTRSGGLRRPLRSRRSVGVLRPALSGTLSAAWASSP